MLAGARHKVDIKTTTDRGRIAGYHLECRHVAGVFQARDNRLGRAHSGRDFCLCQTGRFVGVELQDVELESADLPKSARRASGV